MAGSVEAAERAYADYRLATPALFETLDARVLEGRSFSSGDPRHVAIVSASLAARAWPAESALGRRIEANPWGGVTLEWGIPSPPPTENFEQIPTVTGPPYEFNPVVTR